MASFPHHIVIRVKQSMLYPTSRRRIPVVLNGRLRAQFGQIIRHYARRREGAPLFDVNEVRGYQVDVPVDARAGVPTRIGKLAMVAAHADCVDRA